MDLPIQYPHRHVLEHFRKGQESVMIEVISSGPFSQEIVVELTYWNIPRSEVPWNQMAEYFLCHCQAPTPIPILTTIQSALMRFPHSKFQIRKAESDLCILAFCLGISPWNTNLLNINRLCFNAHAFENEVEIEFPIPLSQAPAPIVPVRRKFNIRTQTLHKSIRTEVLKHFPSFNGNKGIQVLCPTKLVDEVLESWKRASIIYLDCQPVLYPSITCVLLHLGFIVITQFPHHINPLLPWIYLDQLQDSSDITPIPISLPELRNGTVPLTHYIETMQNFKRFAQSRKLLFEVESRTMGKTPPRHHSPNIRALLHVNYHGERYLTLLRRERQTPESDAIPEIRRISFSYLKTEVFTKRWGRDLIAHYRTPLPSNPQAPPEVPWILRTHIPLPANAGQNLLSIVTQPNNPK